MGKENRLFFPPTCHVFQIHLSCLFSVFTRLNNLVPSVILCRSCFLGCREVLFPGGLSNQCASFFEALCPKPAGCVRVMLSREGGAGTGRLLVTRSSVCPSLWGITKSLRKASYWHTCLVACPQRGRNHLGTGAGAFEVPTCPNGLLELQAEFAAWAEFFDRATGSPKNP